MLSHEEYSSKVQDMQKFCIAAGLDHRVIDNVHLFGEASIKRAYLQVYFDGKWETIGSEAPFVKTDEERCAEYWDNKDIFIRSRVADAVSRS